MSLEIDENETIIQSVDYNLDTQTTFANGGETDLFVKNTQPTTNANISDKFYIHNPIKELVLKHNLVNKEQFDKLSQENNFNLHYLTDSYIVNIDKFYKLLSDEFNMKYYRDIDNLLPNVNDDLVDLFIQKQLGVLIVLLPISEDVKEYFILISDPFEYELRDYVKGIIDNSVKINFALTKQKLIKKAIAKCIKDSDVKLQFSLDSNNDMQFLTSSDVEDIENNNKNEVPIIPLVNYIILNAHEQRVSDIHIEPTEENMIVRYRIDGALNTDITLPISVHREVVSRIKIISDMNVAEKRLPQDGRFALKGKDGRGLDLRISTFPTVYGEKVVLRLLEQDALKPSLEELNLTLEQLEQFKTNIHASYGLILITGPTGSGKTTTLYSALSTVDKEKLNVLTLENPVEYRLDGINQMQTNDTIGLTFASGLRTVLRQDPDVIMVGEIRDLETAQMAIRASLTGHMVFSTLHTNDAIGVIIRLVNMGIDPFLVASAVSLVVAQRLIRKICPNCADTQDLKSLKRDLFRKGITHKRLEALNFDLEIMPDFVYGKGCSSCRGSGYLGRQAIFEFFEFNDEIVKEILKPSIDETKIRQLARENNMRTLTHNAWDLVVDGVTTIEEIIRVIGE